jgi:hypothetical protein
MAHFLLSLSFVFATDWFVWIRAAHEFMLAQANSFVQATQGFRAVLENFGNFAGRRPTGGLSDSRNCFPGLDQRFWNSDKKGVPKAMKPEPGILPGTREKESLQEDLMVAAMRGDARTVLHLLLEGADPNEPSERGDSALRRACASGSDDAVRTLLEFGADPGARRSRLTPPLFEAAASDRIGMISMLASKGADVNARNRDGSSPLHYAAMFGHADSVLLLLDLGADLHARDGFGNSPEISARGEAIDALGMIASLREKDALLAELGRSRGPGR